LKEQSILMALLKEFRDGILICDSQRQIIQLNRSLKQFLQLDDRILGRPVAEAIPDAHFQEALDAVLAEGGSRVEEMTWRGKARKMFFEIHLAPVWMPPVNPTPAGEDGVPGVGMDAGNGAVASVADESSGPPDGCVIIFHDMTDIRRTEKMRRDFVANVSHELRTPLSAITGYSETLLDGAMADPDDCREFIQVIHRHSLRLTQLVGDLLDLSKLESPDYQPELAPVSLQGLIQQAFLLVEDKALEKGIHISVEIREPLPRVMAESSSMQQVLTNLLDNAIKYTPPQGRVVISAFRAAETGKIRVDVKDNGIGIEPKYQSRIFERFYRVDKARSRDLGGTGLGLSIVKHIVQLHGGEIRVESAVNQGSTFSLTLDQEPLPIIG
jgi:two-component system phosphate regulon sensor histidine kinase PhoR